MAKGSITVTNEHCKGCLLCADACPMNILELDKSKVNQKGYNPIHCINVEACTGCGICGIICPDSAIRVERIKL